MPSKGRLLWSAILIVMAIVVAGLIASGRQSRAAAVQREDVLQARLRHLEDEMRPRDDAVRALGKRAVESSVRPQAAALNGSEPSSGPVDSGEVAAKVAEEKKTQVMAPGQAVKGVIAEKATKEYVFIGRNNVPVLFTLQQPGRNFWLFRKSSG